MNKIGQRTAPTTVFNLGGSLPANPGATAWGYNARGEITRADHRTDDAFDRAYQFDGIGNRLKAADSLLLTGAVNYTPNALNQYTAIDSLAPDYDLDGNMTAGPLPAAPGVLSTLAWDAENRQISTTVNGVATAYQYDSHSRRIAKTTDGTATVYVYDGWNLVAEYTGFTLTKTHTWGADLSGSLQGAGGVGGLLATQIHSPSGNAGVYYPTYDGNGNVSEYLNSIGGVAAHYEYGPFGEPLVTTGTVAAEMPFRFSTHYTDEETGLVYAKRRYYSAASGRWLSRDPVEEDGGPNLYAYVGNNPVHKVDPFGLFDPATGTAYELGLEWMKGTAPDQVNFRDGDRMTEQIRQSQEVSSALEPVMHFNGTDWLT